MSQDFNYQATRSKALALLMVAQISDPKLREETELRVGELGNAAIDKLYPEGPSSKPENRVVAIPRELSSLRFPFSPIIIRPGDVEPHEPPELEQQGLYERYIIPKGAPLPLAPVLTRYKPEQIAEVLKKRYDMLVALETEFILSIGLSIGDRSPRSA